MEPVSSIYGDLKKYSGKINAIKVTELIATEKTKLSNDAAPVPMQMAANVVPVDLLAQMIAETGKFTAPARGIDSAIELIKPPFTAVKDSNGYVHDAATLAAKCDRGHIHKYFLRDIKAAAGIAKCATCSVGTKFMITVREAAEKALGLPFIVSNTKIEPDVNSTEYINPIINVVLSCVRASGIDESKAIGPTTFIKIHTTTSARKINESLHKFLTPCTLTDDQRAGVAKLVSCKIVKTTPLRKKKVVHKDALPFTQQLADLNITAGKNINPVLARMQLNIVDDNMLCLENSSTR